MKYIVLHPGCAPDIMEAEGISLADLQFHVGGLIDITHAPALSQIGVDIVANDEGLLQGELPNIGYLINEHPVVLVGGLVFVGCDDEGETIGLTQEQIDGTLSFIEKARTMLTPVLLRARLGI